MSNPIDPNNLAGLADSISQFTELAAGHRTKCIEAGFSEQMAEMMAVELHNALVRSVFKGAQTK